MAIRIHYYIFFLQQGLNQLHYISTSASSNRVKIKLYKYIYIRTFGLRVEIPRGDDLIDVRSYRFLPIRNHYLIHKQNKYFTVTFKRSLRYIARRKSKLCQHITHLYRNINLICWRCNRFQCLYFLHYTYLKIKFYWR